MNICNQIIQKTLTYKIQFNSISCQTRIVFNNYVTILKISAFETKLAVQESNSSNDVILS